MAMFCVLSGSALAARPASVDGSQFTIEKLQRIAGSDESFTTGELTAEVGQYVEYEIVVTNTSDSTLNFAELEDFECTGVFPTGETELEPGAQRDLHLRRIPGRIRRMGKHGRNRNEPAGRQRHEPGKPGIQHGGRQRRGT